MRHFALTAVGPDRPGIVAGVTGALVHLDCNLEDTSMTILRGFFAMVLVVAGPDSLAADGLSEALSPLQNALDLAVSVHEFGGPAPEERPGEALSVAVHGADRPGIVHRVASVLAEANVNILDLSTRLTGDDAAPAYVMVLEAQPPPGADIEALRSALRSAARELGVECTVRSSDADLL